MNLKMKCKNNILFRSEYKWYYITPWSRSQEWGDCFTQNWIFYANTLG